MEAQQTHELATIKIEAAEKWKRYAAASEALEKKRETLFAELDKRAREWEKEHSAEILEVEQMEKQAKDAEAGLRRRVVAEYEATGEKSFGYGLSVQVRKTLVFSEETAIAWAMEHGHDQLVKRKIDKPKFDALARALNLDFARESETASARIKWDD